MLSALPGIMMAYHGTLQADVKRVVDGRGGQHLTCSTKDYDWLGPADYFWENSEVRAESWAQENHAGQDAAVRAVLLLGSCLDLLDQQYIDVVERAAVDMCAEHERVGMPIPVNTGAGAYRFDRALIDYILAAPEDKEFGKFDSARAAHIEGEPILGRSPFYRQSHIQIAIYNLNRFKGYFWPQQEAMVAPYFSPVS